MECKERESKYLIKLLAAAISGEHIGAPEADFDCEYLFDLAQLHKVECMVFVGMSQSDELPPNMVSRFDDAFKKSIVADYLQHSEGVRILREMENRGIDCMPLKGWIIKPLYPQPAMRSMCDIDILVKKEQADVTRTLMASLGYDTVDFGGNPDVYMKKPIMNIEVHNALIQDKTDHFATSWSRAVPKKGNNHTFSMTNEDYYIYMSAHLHKHFTGGGTGIRSIADISVFLSHYEDSLNWSYIEDVLTKSGLWQFDRKIKELSEYWFCKGKRTAAVDELENKFLFSAAYGTQEIQIRNSVVSEISKVALAKSPAAKKRIYLLSLIFPGVEVTSASCPFVGNLPFLLPLGWIVRGFKCIFRSRSNIKKAISDVTSIDNSEID